MSLTCLARRDLSNFTDNVYCSHATGPLTVPCSCAASAVALTNAHGKFWATQGLLIVSHGGNYPLNLSTFCLLNYPHLGHEHLACARRVSELLLVL